MSPAEPDAPTVDPPLDGYANDAKSVRLAIEADGLASIVIDPPRRSSGTLNRAVLDDLATALHVVEVETAIRAVVLSNAYIGNTLAGLDPCELLAARSAEELRSVVGQVQDTVDRLARCRVPVVAAIDGAWTGTALALALACRSRIAGRDRRIRLGFPEVTQGLVPIGGACGRLASLVGVELAAELLASGRTLGVEGARRLGLIDDVVALRDVRDEARSLALLLAAGSSAGPTRPGVSGVVRAVLESTAVGRGLVLRAAGGRLRRRSGSSAAPEASRRALHVLREAVTRSAAAAHEAEVAASIELAGDSVFRGLASVTLARRRIDEERGWAARPDAAAREIRRLGVVGGGRSGSTIAALAVGHAQLPTRLWERDDGAVARSLATVRRRLEEQLGRRRGRAEIEASMGRLTATLDARGMVGCDVIVESVFEDVGCKQEVVRQVEALGRDDLVLASNSGTIPLARIVEGCRRPELVAGMHFVVPVGGQASLVEVVAGDRTAPWVVASLVELAKRQKRVPIVVRDGPGCYATRLLAPYVNEAAHLLVEGTRVEDVDHAMMAFGFAVGPMGMLDEVGIDVAARAALTVQEGLGSRLSPPDVLRKLVAEGWSGARTGRGFYRRGAVDDAVYALLGQRPGKGPKPEAITERCLLAMVNEAAHCLGEGVLRDATDGDLGAVLGVGFPASRGGPFRWIEETGAAAVVDRLESLARSHGERFEPAPLLLALVKSGKRLF